MGRNNYHFEYYSNLFQKVTADGRLKITDKQSQYDCLSHMRANRGVVTKKNQAEKIEHLFDVGLAGFHLFDVAISNKSLLKRIDLVFDENLNDLSIEFDLFKLLGITKVDVPTQLNEICAFFEYVVEQMRPHLDGYPMLRVFNEKNKNNKTDYSLNLCARVDNSFTPEQQLALKQYVSDSATLNELFLQTAYKLNKIGRFSTAVLRYSDLLNKEEFQNLWRKFMDEARLQREKA